MGNNNPIGVYDSGLGGLSVWRELRHLMPNESLIYFGDGKNCPYGSRSRDDVKRLADENVGRLVDAGCKMVVMACNTATTAAIEFLRAKYSDVPIVGTRPPVKRACKLSSRGVVGVLATERTIDSIFIRDIIEEYSQSTRIITAVGTGFVELVEQNIEQTPYAEQVIREVMAQMLSEGADQIVLGCTHYPYLIPTMKRILEGREVNIVDPAPLVAQETQKLAGQMGLLADVDNIAQYSYTSCADGLYLEKLRAKAESSIL